MHKEYIPYSFENNGKEKFSVYRCYLFSVWRLWKLDLKLLCNQSFSLGTWNREEHRHPVGRPTRLITQMPELHQTFISLREQTSEASLFSGPTLLVSNSISFLLFKVLTKIL